jgi:hypothetical protein
VLETGLNPYGELYEKGYVSKIKFRIEKTWKGSHQSEITLLSDYWLGTCVGFNFEVGKKYLVYASRKQNLLFTYSECAPSLPLANASTNIEKLNRFWSLFRSCKPLLKAIDPNRWRVGLEFVDISSPRLSLSESQETQA